jgi:cation diffusion facilitator family transporter
MSEKVEDLKKDRDKIIVRTSIIGIAANVFLAAFKAVVGLLSNSIAVILDAVNNLSDALSSVITIIGTFLAGKKADANHPLGHGRIEYISAMLVSAIVLYAGGMSLYESVLKIINPIKPKYTTTSLIIIGTAVVVKIILGTYVKKTGKSVNSGALVASGSDALFDAIISFSVLVSAVILLLTGVSLEAYVGVIISLFIVKSGLDMLLETVDDIIGKRVDRDVLSEIKKTICSEEVVSGAYDMLLHSYGPDRYIGSVHIEVPDTMTAGEIDKLERRIAANVYEKHGIYLAGIGIYSVNTTDPEICEMREKIYTALHKYKGLLQVHGFHVDKDAKEISFDIILDFALEDKNETFNLIQHDIKSMYPDYNIIIAMDLDV